MPSAIEDHIKTILKSLPDKPGVYHFYDDNGEILYVGKAKSLKKRVSSYFQKNKHENGKTYVLVKKTRDIKTIVVNSELDALLLENNLIKKYQPRYNINLRDDKSFPWIRIRNERFPRMETMRNPVKDGSKYYGPYASVKMVKALLSLAKQLYPLRTCNYNLSEENIKSGKFKVCLEYHIGNCLGPCIGEQEEDEYNEFIEGVKAIVKGNIHVVIKQLKALIKKYADEFDYERAQQIKEKLELVERYQARSTIVNSSIKDLDVFSITSDDKYGYVNFFKIANGSIVRGHTVEIKKKLDESELEILEYAVTELRSQMNSEAKEVILPFELTIETDYKTIVPSRGDKKLLLQLSTKNAKTYMLEKHQQEKIKDPERHTNRILETLKKELRLKELPRQIECFDNSNIQGTHPVAACVVFKDAKPSKKDYRHFNIKTVEGPDDFASMREVIYRRYKRLIDEKKSLPQLIVIDGGKGQLSSSLESLEKLNLRGKIAIIGIAKKLEEIYFPGDSLPIYLDKRSESLKIIQQLRNEAHRFGITHHRNRRSKSAFKSELTQIEGVGENTKKKLIRKFKSVKRVKEASLEEICEIIGKAKGQLVFEGLQKK